ncbi:aryl hydrocarbon receptor protein 1 isoform X2 [Periplaneta americana]|uniref:aryl hydrocarbon receptor protein 1 isoform X2 n=1 Tax=Periplaneta americana TaxID=6978 RepID=UPI0037E819F7
MNQLGTVYATKRRRRNGKSLKPPPKDGVTKSNPSKRHRERLNAELDTLASLLPFEQNILSKLDRLSILRLSVSYLRTKSYFQVVMHKDKEDGMHHDSQFRNRDLTTYDHTLLDGEMFLQALNGFLLILTCEGEVFFATHSIESYLGFHQSDIVHQSVYELVHSEDREELQRQLMWNSFLPPESANIVLQDVLQPDNCHLLERSFTVRFRCLLDNTSGFLRLDIRGRIKVLHGQNRKTEEPPLALFAICTPFGPPSLLEIPQKEVMFKSKHKLDLTLVSMDQRGKMLLGYSDAELANLGGYDLVHYDDLAYVASAHQELLKTGASGMIAYRYQTKEGQWQWLQTSSRLVYKNSKPDFVISTHRPLMEEEGRDLLGKRTMDFKVSYLDAGLTNSYFTDADQLVVGATQHHSSPSASHHSTSVTTAPRVNRRYKTQLRDFLSTCRTKRKMTQTTGTTATPNTMAAVDYIAATDTSSTAAAVVAAYSNLNNMYTTPYPSTSPADTYMGHPGNFHQTLYPAAAALDNRFLAATTENLFHQYRPLGTYYPDYHSAATTPYVSNGFLDMSPRATTCTLPTYEPAPATSGHHMHHQLATKATDDKLYSCQQQVDTALASKYAAVVDGGRGYVVANTAKCLDVTTPYSVSPTGAVTIQSIVMTSSPTVGKGAKNSPPMDGMSSTGSSPAATANGLVTPKLEDIKTEGSLLQAASPHLNHQQVLPHHYSPPAASVSVPDAPRQTVLMWGSGGTTTLNHSRSPPLNTIVNSSPGAVTNGTPTSYTVQDASPAAKKYNNGDPLKSLAEMNSLGSADACKWSGTAKPEPASSTSPTHPASSPALGAKSSYHHHHQHHQVVTSHHHHHHQHHQHGGGLTYSETGTGTEHAGQRQRLPTDKSDGSPLLSISEVTNTLLNHE